MITIEQAITKCRDIAFGDEPVGIDKEDFEDIANWLEEYKQIKFEMVGFNGFDKGVIGKKLPSDNTLNKAIKILKEQYERAKRIGFVKNPLAYALYQTWKIVDEGSADNE